MQQFKNEPKSGATGSKMELVKNNQDKKTCQEIIIMIQYQYNKLKQIV